MTSPILALKPIIMALTFNSPWGILLLAIIAEYYIYAGFLKRDFMAFVKFFLIQGALFYVAGFIIFNILGMQDLLFSGFIETLTIMGLTYLILTKLKSQKTTNELAWKITLFMGIVVYVMGTILETMAVGL